MNFSTNWRDRRTGFTPKHYSIANYTTETKNEMRTSFGEDLFLNKLHLIPDPLMKNLADTIITEEKMAPKSKLENHSDVKTNENMNIEPDYSPLTGIANFFSGVMNVISNAMFSKPKEADFGAETGSQMAVPPLWQGAKLSDENKILHDGNRSNDMASEILASEMTDCRQAVAHCQNKIEQVRLLLGSKPVPCSFRTRRRPKKVFVEASSVEDCFEDAFSPEDFENVANDSYIQYSSPVCYHDHVFHEVDSPRVKIETAESPKCVSEAPCVTETTEIIKIVPEIDTCNENELEDVPKTELVASCEDKISKLKALLQERKKKAKTVIEPEPVTIPEPKEQLKPKTANKVKDKRFKNPNRSCSKRMKLKMKKNIQDDVLFANDINSEDLSSVENSPSMGYIEKYMTSPNNTEHNTEHEYFNEVSGRFHSTSATESEDSFQIVFNDNPRLRRVSDCDSEDSYIVFEESPDSCYTSNDVFGESEDSEEYDSDSDLSDSGCGNMSFTLASLSKSVCNLADDSLYDEPADEVDCARVDVTVRKSASLSDLKTGLLIDEKKKLLRKDLPAKKVHFSTQPPKVHVMRVWSFAARQARAGHWERYAIDRERFKRRIADVDVAVSWVLKPQHRSRVMFQRFMPLWNAQKRKELAEKKEKEAQEKLRKEEELEKLKAEEERALACEEEVGENESKAETNDTEDDTRELENKKSEEEGAKQEQDAYVNFNGKLTAEDNTNNEKILKNDIKATENETKIGNKTCMSNNSEIIPLNDKILDMQTDFVAKKILDT